jgi:spore coat protein U-like protein
MKRLLALSAAAIALGPSLGSAATATNNLSVSATVVASCRIDPASLGFGNYDGTLNEAEADITVTCNTATPHWVDLDNGGNFLGTRRMENGGNYLPYELFRDENRTVAWTIGDPGDGPYKPTTAGSVQQVYGRISAGHIVPPAALPYTDTVVMTVNF